MKLRLLALYTILITLTACGSISTDINGVSLNKDATVYPIVATVNGEEIDRSFYQKNLLHARKTALMQNQDPFTVEVDLKLRTQVLDQMIANVLLAQAAEQENITIDTIKIDEQIHDVIERYETKEGLIQELEANGSSLEELKKDLERSTRTQQFIENYIHELELDVTAEEIQELYDEIATTEEAPELSEIKEQIQQKVMQQKQTMAIEELITVLKSQADIITL